MTTTKTRAAVVETSVETDPNKLLADQALTALNAYGDAIADIRGKSIDQEITLMVKASEVLRPWYDAQSATYAALNDGHDMPVKLFHAMLVQAVGPTLNRNITPAVVTSLVKVLPLHTTDTRQIFGNLSEATSEARYLASKNKTDAPVAIPLTINTYLTYLPRIADGWYDMDGQLTPIGVEGTVKRDNAATLAANTKVEKRSMEAAKSDFRGNVANAVTGQAAAKPGESALVAARRVAYDALTLLAAAELAATDAERIAADAVIVVKL
jgi:hypothetical protein